jgi:hypothetical protein
MDKVFTVEKLDDGYTISHKVGKQVIKCARSTKKAVLLYLLQQVEKQPVFYLTVPQGK